MDFEFIFDYLYEHAWEIVLGVEMLCLKIFKKKTPEEIQAKKEQREKKRIDKQLKGLKKALKDCDEVCINPAWLDEPACLDKRYTSPTLTSCSQDMEKELK